MVTELIAKKKHNASPTKPIRVVIADDHPVIREGLSALMKRQKDIRVVGDAATGRQAIRQYFLHRPDVILLDLRMPDMNGFEAMEAILQKAPDAKVVLLSAFDGAADIFRSLHGGAKAYLPKNSPHAQLLESIREVSRGQVYVPPAIGLKLAAQISAQRLTKRETAIMELMALGKSNKEIAASLGVAPGTVKIHVTHVLKKLGVEGRTEAVRVALERGIIHLQQ